MRPIKKIEIKIKLMQSNTIIIMYNLYYIYFILKIVKLICSCIDNRH